jgi:hypothetical protein
MADSPISPDVATQLASSPLVQDESVKEQLGALAAPVVDPVEIPVAQNPEALAPVEAPLAAPAEVPEALAPAPETTPQEQLLQELTTVPTEVTPVPLDQKSPEQLTSKERQALISQKLGERDAALEKRLLNGEMNPDEELAYLQEKSSQMQREKQQELLSPDVQIRLDKIQSGIADYLQAKNTFDERNRLRQESGLPLITDVPDISNFVSAEDGQFAAEAGLEVPEELQSLFAQSIQAKEQDAQLAAAEDIQRNLATTAKAQQNVAQDQVIEQKKQEAQAKDAVKKQVKEVETQFTSLSDLFENASTGRKVSAALGIMFGGLAQGFSGGSVNPVLDVLDKTFKNNLAAKQVALKKIKQEADRAAAKIPDPIKQVKLQKESALLQKAMLENEKLMIDRNMGSFNGSTPIPEDQIRALRGDSKERELLVTVPSTKQTFRGNSKEAVSKANTALRDLSPGITSIDNLISAIDDPNFNRFNLTDERRAALDAETGAVIGALRIPILGPGVMTESERQFMVKLLGSPTRLTTLSSFEKAKLKAVKGVLKRNIKAHLDSAGVTPPPSKAEVMNQANIAKLKKRLPKATQFEIIQSLQKTNQWHPED